MKHRKVKNSAESRWICLSQESNKIHILFLVPCVCLPSISCLHSHELVRHPWLKEAWVPLFSGKRQNVSRNFCGLMQKTLSSFPEISAIGLQAVCLWHIRFLVIGEGIPPLTNLVFLIANGKSTSFPMRNTFITSLKFCSYMQTLNKHQEITDSGYCECICPPSPLSALGMVDWAPACHSCLAAAGRQPRN